MSIRPFGQGLSCFKSANFLLAMSVVLIPFVRWRCGSQKGRRGAWFAVCAITVAVSLSQSVSIRAYLAHTHQPETGAMTGILTVAVFIACVLALILAGSALSRLWNGNGFTIVIATMALLGLAGAPARVGAIIMDDVTFPWKQSLLWIPSAFVLMFLACVWGLLQVHTLEIRDRRDDGTTIRLAIPCALTGRFSVVFAGALASALHLLARTTGWQSRWTAYGGGGYAAILSILICLCAVAYGIVLLPSGRFRSRLAADGLELRAPFPSWALHAPWVAVLLVLYGAVPVLLSAVEIPMGLLLWVRSTLLLAAFLLLAGVTQTALRRRGWQVVFEHPEFTEIIAVQAVLARHGMGSAVTWREPYGALSGMFVGPLADKRVSVSPENTVEAEGLLEEYRLAVLTRETGSEEASGEGSSCLGCPDDHAEVDS